MGILDKIIDTQQQQSLQEFELALLVKKILDPLKEREKLILSKRYGLNGNTITTLKTIGEEHGLTRERVRQIEKELLKNLRHQVIDEQTFEQAKNLILNGIMEHGGIMAEDRLLNFLNIADEEETYALKFILNLIPEVEYLTEEGAIRPSWAGLSLNKELLQNYGNEAKNIFNLLGKPLVKEEFIEAFKDSALYKQNQDNWQDKVVANYLHTVASIEPNVFGEFGLTHWNEINPKDVGDKAYLVMKHHHQPEHYSMITELINKHKFDNRIAYKETVHNKLIKDTRFVLVGRGMYALVEWGYKPGVVADIITEILKENEAPLSRDQIVQEVLKKRLVKKNTILVGLSNKKFFKKVGKNLYTLTVLEG